MRFLIAILVLLLLNAVSVRAGEIHTRDGKTYQGDIRFLDTGKIAVVHDGQTTTLDMTEIMYVLISPPGKPSAPHGLLGEYFQGREFNEPKAQRIDSTIDF